MIGGGSGKIGESGGLDFRHSATNVTSAILRIEKGVLIIKEIDFWTYFLRIIYGLL